ncbi:xanthine dehydrogenase family protein molybdopterin-binding subunit [Candidatus Acidianus copahuensis]|nr:molybdopterin cofactor-binding domain-containing protein [Candidatus Acidianus copahuensis]
MERYYVGDSTGNYKSVKFIRSTVPFAKFKVSGRSYTWEDLKFNIPRIFGLEGKLKDIEIPLLAKDRSLYVGQPIAIVLGNDPYDAEDKAENVEVEYEELNGDIYDFVPNNIALEGQGGEDFAEKDRRINLDLTFSRSSPFPMEGRAVAVRHEGDKMVIYISNQAPTVAKKIIEEMLNFQKVEIKVPWVGGGFGSKQDIVPEELAVIALSYATGLDLKWIESKTEHALTSQGRGQRHFVEVFFESNGKIRGYKDSIVYDLGAFPLPWSGISPLYVTLMNLKGIYDIKVKYEFKVVVSNKPPQGAFRGFGRPEAFFVVERVIDAVSRILGIDPIEIRRKNLGKLNAVGNVDEIFRRIEKKYREVREKYGKGVGVSMYVHYGSPSSKVLINEEKSNVGGYECVSLRLDDRGIVKVKTTVVDMGQGIASVIRRIVEKELGTKAEVEVGSDDVRGFGSWASRSVVTAANATLLAAKELKEKIDKEGGLSRLKEKISNSPWEIEDKEIYSVKCYEPEEMVGSISGQISAVKVDWPNIKVLYHYAIVDVGVAGNEDNIKGQIMGGIVQAIGGSLLESVEDPLSYAIPTALEAPLMEVELLHTPSNTPGGFRPVGENSISGAYVAIINALSDYGEVKRIPVSPNDIKREE